MKQLWLLRLCLGLMLFVAANRIFAWTETSTKSKYTLQIQADEEEEDDDVFLPAIIHDCDFNTQSTFLATKKPNFVRILSASQIPLFIRFRNLRL
jgi:hypothetical protein